MREQHKGLYSPAFEHDNCGIGAVVNSRGIKSHLTVERALHIVENLEQKGIFDVKGAVEYVAERLGVTNFTVYNYLKTVRCARR